MTTSDDQLQAILDSFPASVTLRYGSTKGGSDEDPTVQPERVVAVFQFSEKGFGFGEITMVQTEEGCFIDTEHMNRETVKRYLCSLVDGAVMDREKEPERHALYNRVMGSACSEHCRICFPEGSQ